MPANPGHSHVITLWEKKSFTLMTTTEFIILNQVFNQQLSCSQTSSFTHPAQPDQLSTIIMLVTSHPPMTAHLTAPSSL